ncbi:MAG: hypothetical protein WCO56_23475, partial [Verrucomicrobiota bacterium]
MSIPTVKPLLSFPCLNRRHFLATSLTVTSAVTLGLRLDGAPGAGPLKPKHRYLTDASKLLAGETINGPARVLDLKGRKGINPQS